MFFVGKSWAADEEIVAVLARMAENVSFALDNFERAAEKAKADAQKERLTRMFAALSATNEAIMRAKSRSRAVRAGLRVRRAGRQVHLDHHRARASPTAIISTWSRWRGRRPRTPATITLSTNADASGRARPQRHGLPHPAGLHQQRLSHRSARHRLPSRGSQPTARTSGAAFPLLVHGEIVGVMLFLSAEKHTFTPEFVELLQRLADNVCPLRWRISIAPTKRTGRTSASNISLRTTA